MLNILLDYLRQKAEAIGFVSKAYSQAIKASRENQGNSVSFPVVYENGEAKQISFDTYSSLVFFMLDGDIERETEPGEISSEEDQVTETYKVKAYFFHSGKEITDCAAFSQQAAYSLGKYICADNYQLEDELNLQSATITVSSFQFIKEDVWNELHSGIPYGLGDNQQLCSFSLEIEISGVESCFVNDPCDLGAFSWEFSTQSSCDVVDDCLGIDRANGSESLFLTEKGTMKAVSSGASTLGGLTNVADAVDSSSNGIYAWNVVSNAFSLILAYSKAQVDSLIAALQSAIDSVEAYADLIKTALDTHIADTTNPHQTTLDQARTADNFFNGEVDMNGNELRNLPTPTHSDAAVPKSYVDGLVDNVLKQPQVFTPAGTYPVTYNGNAVQAGDSFRIASAGTLGARTVNAEDLLIALVDTPGQTDANWQVLESNRDQAGETVKGVAQLATQAEVENELTSENTHIVTPQKMWLGLLRFTQIAWTWAAKQIFTLAPRFNSVTASQYLKVDGSKDLTSVGAIPATDITEDSTHRFATDTEKSTWNTKAEIYYTPDTHSGTTYTLAAGDVNKLQRFTSASAVAITVPNDTNAATILIGYVFRVVQSGAGQLTLTPDSGVTLNNRNGLKSAGQYAVIGIEKVAANTWLVYGDTTT